jgi:IclR family acetate operon transcriptional repressor
MFTEVGRRANLHDTGVGKAILSTLADDEIRGIVGRVGMPTPTSRSHSSAESLLGDVAEIRRRGYAIDDEEQEPGVRCYAVPVPRAPSPMAISVSGPLSRVDEAFGARAVPVLQSVAETIGAGLQG